MKGKQSSAFEAIKEVLSQLEAGAYGTGDDADLGLVSEDLDDAIDNV